MLINFKNVILHNFLSYGHCEIDLSNKRYCLVSGINKNPRDNALSNGSGKSSWSSAICWALTGETIQGLTSNIKNINIDEDLCYVTLIFDVDDKAYKITRYKNPKSDLKIELNGNDISGKGIRESESILATQLPDLTSDLIASVIILGQGLPCKFTDNTPSGRKEVLEKLAKSDFMIQDLKERINARLFTLNQELRIVEDTALSAKSNKTLLESQLEKNEIELKNLNTNIDYDSKIIEIENSISNINIVINDNNQLINQFREKESNTTTKLKQINDDKQKALLDENNQFTEFTAEYLNRKSPIDANILALSTKIQQIKNIKDVCPTCGQKLPNVIKPSTELDEIALNELQKDVSELTKKYEMFKKEHERLKSEIETSYSKDISEINYELKQINDMISLRVSDLNIKQNQLITLTTELNRLQLEKSNHTQKIKKIQETLVDLNNSISKLNDDIKINDDKRDNVQEHIKVLNQMNTLVKRDFRGFLLSNVINFISSKAKEYSKDIFGNDYIEFSLDGNNIDITYSDKAFENLSGGEKQRIDLIIQFAIRDMLKEYLGFSSNILVLDEIFDQLDIYGCNSILNLISSKLDDIESIFIISHRADELEIPYDCELLVTKSEQGVSEAKWA